MVRNACVVPESYLLDSLIRGIDRLGSNSQKPDGDNSHECERPRLHHFVEQHALNSEFE